MGERKMAEKWEIIMDACLALSESGKEECISIIRQGYPFDPKARLKQVKCEACVPTDGKAETLRCWDENQSLKMKMFARDGFINRFTGQQLIFPAVLRLLSKEFPRDFPYQQYWRFGEVHLAYHEVGACTCRLVPEGLGGMEDEGNLITTTMPYILARSNVTIEEAGWKLTREGYVDEWDGMSTWFVEYVKDNPELRNINFFNLWYNAAKKVLEL